MESLFGLNAPILPDEPEEEVLRKRVAAQSTGVVRTLVNDKEAEHQQLAELPDPTVPSETSEPPAQTVAEISAQEAATEVVAEDVTEVDVTTSEETGS